MEDCVIDGNFCWVNNEPEGSDQIAPSTFPHNKQDMRANENSLLPEGSGGVAALNTQGEAQGHLDTGEAHEGDQCAGRQRQGRQDRTQNWNNQARQMLT